MDNLTTTNDSSLFPAPRCPPFDPYWVYALTVPFLGVIFNGLLLTICILFRHQRQRRRSSAHLLRHNRALSVSFTSAAGPLQNVQITDLSPLTNQQMQDFCHQDAYPSPRPEVSLNWFVTNCAASTLIGSCLRTITTAYLFTYDYVMCPNVDYEGVQFVEILVYIQYSVFSVAYLNFLIVLNLDKLLFVLKPLHYRALMTRNRVLLVCSITWVLSLAWFPLYFAQDDEDVVRWGTILVTVLMVGPSLFCLVSSTILAVVVFRLRMHDRKQTTSEWAQSPRSPRDFANEQASRASVYCSYVKSTLRLFQAVVWTCVTSLPHPISIIISYYLSMGDPTTDVVVKIFIGYLSIAYFSGTPLMIFLIYPVYWKRFKSQFLCID